MHCYIVFSSWFSMCDLPILWIILLSASLYTSESSFAILASLCHLFGGNWDLRDGHQKMLILWLLRLLWVMKSFVSDPRGSCLLPVSIQLWQAKLLA